MPLMSPFLPALTSSFLWDQRDIPSSESAGCISHRLVSWGLTSADQALTQKFQTSPGLLCSDLKARMVPSGGHRYHSRHCSQGLVWGHP